VVVKIIPIINTSKLKNYDYDRDSYDINKAAKDVAEATKKGAKNK